MADLRITGVSNNQLELQAADGTRHYLEITDDLLKALRNREVSLPQNLTPREIQQLVRHGSSISEIVEQTGADQDLVERFAKPIIAELNHIVTLARNIRLSLAGDRFAEPTLVEFGSVMDERLVNNSARNIGWTARKSVDGDWLVSISFDTKDGSGVATWSFDPKQLFLAPENETALQLSNGVPVSIAKTVTLVQEETKDEVPTEESPLHPTVMLTVVPEIEVERVEASNSITDELFVDEPVTQGTLRVVEETVISEEVVLADSDESHEIPDSTVETELDAEQKTEHSDRPQSTSRWAEVLFGSKEDEES